MEIDTFGLGKDLFWNIVSAEPLLTFGIIVIFGGALLFVFIVNVLREQRIKRSGILDVDKMPGREFEEFLQVLLKSRGYKVQLTTASGDYGADLVLKGNG